MCICGPAAVGLLLRAGKLILISVSARAMIWLKELLKYDALTFLLYSGIFSEHRNLCKMLLYSNSHRHCRTEKGWDLGCKSEIHKHMNWCTFFWQTFLIFKCMKSLGESDINNGSVPCQYAWKCNSELLRIKMLWCWSGVDAFQNTSIWAQAQIKKPIILT